MKKVVKLFAFIFVAFLLIGVTKVNADEADVLKRMKEIYNLEAPNGTFEFNSVKPKNFVEYDFFASSYYEGWSSKYASEGINYGIECDDNIECKFLITSSNPYIHKEYDVTIKWQDANTLVKKNVDSYIEKLANIQGEDENGYYNQYLFKLTDLNLINYYVTANTRELDSEKFGKITNYTDDVKKFFENADLTYRIDVRAGVNYLPFRTLAFGGLVVSYNGVAYASQDKVGAKPEEILYVPSDTELTDEALIEAASKRLKEYMPNNKITITKGYSFDHYDDEHEGAMDFSLIADLSKTTDHTYIFNFGDFTVDFLIVADSSKMSEPIFSAKNLDKDITITSKESSIPLDTMIKAYLLNKDGEEYLNIKNILKQNNLYSIDLSLYSNVKNTNITKLDNGIFEVTMPVPSELEGKVLAVYYVNEEGKLEEHDATVKDGYATFTTNHFSVYTLAEKATNVVNNPQTGDDLIFYLIFGISSLMVFTFCVLSFNKRKLNKSLRG